MGMLGTHLTEGQSSRTTFPVEQGATCVCNKAVVEEGQGQGCAVGRWGVGGGEGRGLGAPPAWSPLVPTSMREQSAEALIGCR